MKPWRIADRGETSPTAFTTSTSLKNIKRAEDAPRGPRHGGLHVWHGAGHGLASDARLTAMAAWPLATTDSGGGNKRLQGLRDGDISAAAVSAAAPPPTTAELFHG